MLKSCLKRVLHVGQTIPVAELTVVAKTHDAFQINDPVPASVYFSGKKVVLVGFPGAFTPTCWTTHLPGYLKSLKEFKALGVSVIGLTVNDPFVLKEFAGALGGDLEYIADGAAILTKALDAATDLTAKGLGLRTRRFSALLEDGKITVLNDEGGPQMTELSQAANMLAQLK